MNRLDVLIFGASGFTGKYTVYQSVKILAGLKWGVAGRSKEKLEDILKEMGNKAGIDLSKIPIILADLKDEQSLKKMTEKAKVIVNCCGPYMLYGEPVIKACIATSTHHVDVSGEPNYMEQMQSKYNEAARDKGIYIISACGFESIPVEMGIVFLEEKFGGVVNTVETYLRSYPKKRIPIDFSNYSQIHYGTWASLVDVLGEVKQLLTKDSKALVPKIKDRSIIHKSEFVKNSWCLPFHGTDPSVVMRSQRYFATADNKRPIQLKCYMSMGRNILISFGAIFYLAYLLLISQFKFGRKLLLDYPRFFTAGIVSHKGPTEESAENTHFQITLVGEGWKDNSSESTGNYTNPMNKKIITKVTGDNPGYGATCIALLLTATTILNENKKMPDNGGVFPPAAAFKNTSLINELCNNGFTFEVIKVDE
ncbi:unnamed protein product [Diamesa tonsa]